jgi:phage gpG-like protein
MDAQVRTEGLAELRRDLKRLDPLIDKELRDAIKDAADKVAVTAGALAPRDSGALQQSIRPFVSGANASVGSTLPYAGVLEFGGTISPRGVPITIKGTGFVGRAVEDHADELVEDIGDGIERAASRAGWHPGR